MARHNSRDIEELSADELLKQTEEPMRKRRKIDDHPDEEFRGLEGSQELEDEDEDEGMKNQKDESGDEDSDSEDYDAERDYRKSMSRPSFIAQGPSRMSSSLARKKNSIEVTSVKPEKPKVTSFAELGVSKILVSSLAAMSIRSPTEVQAACIPPLLEGQDCVGNAKTGSGKTVAFAAPILQKLSVDPYGIFALVLTPTRELAFQISEQFAVLGAPLNIQTAVIVGGMDMVAQAIELNNRPHVIIATPGRIVDHMKSSNGEFNLSRVKFLVLDEADRLLTSTFSSDLSFLFNAIPKERQTCLFTATMTDSIETIIASPPRPGKQKPFVHRMGTTVETVETLTQYYILVPSHVREPYLFHLLCNPPSSITHLRRAPPEPAKSSRKSKPSKPSKKSKQTPTTENTPDQPPPTIIFCGRARTAAYLTHVLQTLGIRSTALHSRLTQRERLNSLNLFRACVVPVLICTDVGARGLDIEEVALVVNWDIPSEPEEYTHRVGRTARKGRAGVAVSFVTERDEERIIKIEDRIHTKLTEMTLPEEKVLEKLNTVSTAKRLANMELHDSDFGKREEVHKIKQVKRQRVGELRA